MEANLLVHRCLLRYRYPDTVLAHARAGKMLLVQCEGKGGEADTEAANRRNDVFISRRSLGSSEFPLNFQVSAELPRNDCGRVHLRKCRLVRMTSVLDHREHTRQPRKTFVFLAPRCGPSMSN